MKLKETKDMNQGSGSGVITGVYSMTRFTFGIVDNCRGSELG